MLVSLTPNYLHGCSTATRRDNNHDYSSAQEASFIPITVSSVGRRHLISRKKSARLFKSYPKPARGGGLYWRHPTKVEPNKAWVRPHSSNKARRGVFSLDKKAALKLSSTKAVSQDHADSMILHEAMDEMKIQKEFVRELRYLKAYHKLHCTSPGDRDRMNRNISERKALVCQLHLIIKQLGDNRKHIVTVCRRQQCRVESVRSKEKLKARIIGTNQREKPVRRNGEVITERRAFGGRSPLPSGKCRSAAYHDPSIETKVNGKTYKRQNGYITPVEDFLSVGTKVIMDSKGQHRSKQVWKSYQAHRKEVKGQEDKLKHRYQVRRQVKGQVRIVKLCGRTCQSASAYTGRGNKGIVNQDIGQLTSFE